MDGCYRSSPRPGRSRDLDASSSLMTGLGGALSPITVYSGLPAARASSRHAFCSLLVNPSDFPRQPNHKTDRSLAHSSPCAHVVDGLIDCPDYQAPPPPVSTASGERDARLPSRCACVTRSQCSRHLLPIPALSAPAIRSNSVSRTSAKRTIKATATHHRPR